MKRFHRLLAYALAILLAACIVAAYVTRQIGANAAPAKAAAAPSPQVDQHLIQTADRLSALADTPDEQALGRDAVQLADHEVDQAFASALRDAGKPSAPATGPLRALADRVSKWTAQVASDKDRVDRLTKAPPSKSASAGDQLAVAKAQLALDQDELADAQQDFTRQGGDQEANLQRAFEQYQAAQAAAATQKNPAPPATRTLSEQLLAWLSLRDRKHQVDLAATESAANAATLRKAHDALEALAAHKPPPTPAAGAATPAASDSTDSDQEDVSALIASLQHLSDQKKSMADLDQRIEDSQHLAEVYARWGSFLEARQRGVLHLLLNSLAMVLAIVLAAVLADGLIRKLFRHAQPRRVHHLRVMSTVAIQLIAVALIVLVIFGPPNQLSTIIGLATAGLTVALRDFIVAFFGWFALMGRNGIRVGDWVEIRGVSGEVVEIGMLKTIVLEMGNWGSTGSPTGRRVAFVNSFAIEDHYFNFSTAGQWFWDELQVTLPSTADPYRLSQAIRDLVERATEADAREAEQDWKQATSDEGARPFSAKPLVDLRPSAGGLDAVVRYITHAPKRYEVKSRLLEEIVALVHKSVAEPAREASTSL